MQAKKLLGRLLSFNKSCFGSSEKEEVLKTYLEIIPPYKFLEIVEKKTNTLESMVCSLESLSEEKHAEKNLNEELTFKQQIKVLQRYVKRKCDLIPMPMLIRILRVCCKLSLNTPDSVREESNRIYLHLLRQVKFNAENLPIESLVNFVYELVKQNKKEFALMKEVEKVIIEEPIRIHYPLIRKILWAYTYVDVGSPVLYHHISRSIAVGQYELAPLDLADAAYLLSKVSENAKGGYGVFSLAECHLKANLPRMSFAELVKAASLMLTQNIGSNQFQAALEAAVYRVYPAKDRLKIRDMVLLLKATSGYFFKDNALLHLLKTSTLRLAQYAKLEQLEDIVWSWGRAGKGDRELWQCIEVCVLTHLVELKPRQIAFIYHALCSTPHCTISTLEALENTFLKLELHTVNEHFLIKFLLGMQRRRLYAQEVFLKLSSALTERIESLSNAELNYFLCIMNESDIDYSNKHQIKDIVDTIKRAGQKLSTKLYTMKLTEITELAYLWTKLEFENDSLLEKCLLQLSNVMDIPKSSFIKAFFVFTMKEHYEKGVEFLPLIQELTKYGPIGYFFSPYEFPLLAYCILHYHYNSNIKVDELLLSQVKDALVKINPVILNPFVLKGYEEAMNILQHSQHKE